METRATGLLGIAGVLVVGLFAGLYSAPSNADDPEKIARLVQRLGSDRFAEREAAARVLDGLGEKALPALREASTQGEDAEVRRRAQALVARIEKRLLTERILTPKRVRLTFRDTPVVDAVRELAAKAGYPGQVVIQGDLKNVSQRRITWDSGELTFWEALTQLCERASLIEKAPQVDSSKDSKDTNDQLRARPALPLGLRPGAAANDGKIYLTDGKPVAYPTAFIGSLRIRALPVPDNQKLASEPGFIFEVSPEPGLSWQNLVDVRIERAVDEHGQQLQQPVSLAGGISPMDKVAWQANIVILNEVDVPGFEDNLGRQMLVRLRGAKEPSGTLKEVFGMFAARVQTPVESILTIDDVLNAGGQTYTLDDGTSLKVVGVQEVKRGTTRQYVVRAECQTQGGNVLPRFVRINRGAGQVAIVQVQDTPKPSDLSLALLDVQGKPYQLVRQSIDGFNMNFNVCTQSVNVTFQARADQGPPGKLVMNGRRIVSIEVPFTLRDVPVR